jgi:hypothetical protein
MSASSSTRLTDAPGLPEMLADRLRVTVVHPAMRLAAFAVSVVWLSEIYESGDLDSRSENVADVKNCAPVQKLKAQMAY